MQHAFNGVYSDHKSEGVGDVKRVKLYLLALRMARNMKK